MHVFELVIRKLSIYKKEIKDGNRNQLCNRSIRHSKQGTIVPNYASKKRKNGSIVCKNGRIIKRVAASIGYYLKQK